MQTAHECGAEALTERARHELLALGLRPRRRSVSGADSLTEREERVSKLASQGLTNRQIAEAMFVSPNTVEYHLTNSFRKLGISTRRELGSALVPSGDPPARGLAASRAFGSR
jgi:DNA-binding CsgD family transcriptional regulator